MVVKLNGFSSLEKPTNFKITSPIYILLKLEDGDLLWIPYFPADKSPKTKSDKLWAYPGPICGEIRSELFGECMFLLSVRFIRELLWYNIFTIRLILWKKINLLFPRVSLPFLEVLVTKLRTDTIIFSTIST